MVTDADMVAALVQFICLIQQYQSSKKTNRRFRQAKTKLCKPHVDKKCKNRQVQEHQTNPQKNHPDSEKQLEH